MGECILHGNGGGSSLSFRVIGGTSTPASPKENDIWVNTNTEITGWQFGTDDPNLLDFTTWANEIGVLNGTKSVSGNSVTLTANTSGDCYTDFTSLSKANIPCTPGKTYIMQWDHSGAYGDVYMFPGADVAGLVMTSAASGKLEYTAGADVTFFTFRIGVLYGNTSATYSNIRITEKDRAFSPGSVWVQTDNSSSVPFNALKKNGLMAYPLKAKQYIGGAWVEKTAKSYQGGAWADWWNGQLYESGNEYESITGGYSTYGSGATLTKNQDHLYIKSQGNSGVYTNNPVDMTDYNTLTFDWTCVRGGIDTQFQVRSDRSTGTSGWAAGTKIIGPDTKRQTVSLDISNLSGSYYVGIGRFSSGGPNETKIHSIIMS